MARIKLNVDVDVGGDEKKKRRKRTAKERRNTLIGAGLTAAGLMMLFKDGIFTGGGFKWWAVGLIALAAYGIGKVVGIMSTPLDLTTHNRQDQPKETETIEPTGNERADDFVRRGQQALEDIRRANDEIRDPGLTRQMDELEEKCAQIFRTVAEKPERASSMGHFMSYYLPTTLKMLESYRVMQNRGISPSELAKHRDTLERGLTMVNTACQKQLDHLYEDTMLDISTDIDVLEQMLKRDGFVEGDLSAAGIAAAVEQAKTAAAAHMSEALEEQHAAPMLDIPEDSEASPSFFRRKQSQRTK